MPSRKLARFFEDRDLPCFYTYNFNLSYANTTPPTGHNIWEYTGTDPIIFIFKRKIFGAAELGHSPAKIARTFNCPDSTIRTAIKINPLQHEGKTRKRTGQPCEYTDRDVQKLVNHVRANPKDT